MAIRRFFDEEEARQYAASSGAGNYRRGDDRDGRPVWEVEYEEPNSNPYADQGLEDWEWDLAKVPIINLFGPNQAVDRASNLQRQQAAEDAWADLMGRAPHMGDFTVQYQGEDRRDEYGDLRGRPTEINQGSVGLDRQRAALAGLSRIYEQGGYTRADQMQRNANATATGQRLRGANEAAIQQARARGMSGGGQELAARLSGSQGMAIGNQMADASIQQAAMQRAMQALQAQGAIGASVNQGELARQRAIDDFNQRNMDWRRDREQRNTVWENRGRESAANAAQQWYQNRERATAGLTGQYQAGQSNNRQDAAAEYQAQRDGLAGLGSALEEIL